MQYLTDEDYKQAAANGIPRKVAYNRFYTHSWDKEKTITKPVYTSIWYQYKEICWEHGISNNTFHRRIRSGMSPEEAANTLWIPHDKRKSKDPKVTPETIETALKNGIKPATLKYRVYALRWNPERAATVPPRGKQ
jgi:hypothetical protein